MSCLSTPLPLQGLLCEYGQAQQWAEMIRKNETLWVWPETCFLPLHYERQWTALELEALVDFELIAMLKWNYKICRDSIICAICVHLFCSSI